MIRYALPILASTILTNPAAAAEVQMQVQGPVVELGITEVVRSDPDVAQIGAGVTTRAMTASEALKQNAEQMDRLIAKLRTLGIKREDIQTSSFNLNPQYNYNQQNSGTPEFIGYDVTNQVNVKLRDMSKVGSVFDALVTAGATNLYGPNFSLEDDVRAKEVARTNAFKRGKIQAEEYARMSGYSGVRLLEVSENFQSMGPVGFSANAIRVTAVEASTPTPIEPGQVGTGVTINVKYEMTR